MVFKGQNNQSGQMSVFSLTMTFWKRIHDAISFFIYVVILMIFQGLLSHVMFS